MTGKVNLNNSRVCNIIAALLILGAICIISVFYNTYEIKQLQKENNELRKIQNELNKPYYDSIQKETEHYKRK